MGKRAPAGVGPSQRQLRVGELVRRALSDVLIRGDLYDPELTRAPITVGECRPSPDLRHVTVFAAPLGGGDGKTMLEALRRNRGALRREVSRAVTLKFAPELHFQLDHVYDRLEETTRLLSNPHVRQSLEADDDDA